MPQTLADLGITPARAWALHKVAADPKDYHHRALLDALDSGGARKVHDSFGVVVAYVQSAPADHTDIETEVWATALINGCGRPRWRCIGYVDDRGRFVDHIEVASGDFPGANVTKGAA